MWRFLKGKRHLTASVPLYNVGSNEVMQITWGGLHKSGNTIWPVLAKRLKGETFDSASALGLFNVIQHVAVRHWR